VMLAGDFALAHRVRAEVLDGRTGRELNARWGRTQRVRAASPGRGGR
jgi:hypothetical protein